MDNSIEKEALEKDSIKTEDDDQRKLEDLIAQVNALESENKKSNEEFGVQRAKMRELFLQQEEKNKKLNMEIDNLRIELERVKSQADILEIERIKGQDELSSLQELLQATLEDCGKYEAETLFLRQKNEKLEADVKLLREQQQLTSSSSGTQILGAPGAMFTKLARTVASQLGASDSQHQAENLEDSMRKAKEGAEMLKSLLMPLEEEIASLKEKLRSTDAQLRLYQSNDPNYTEGSMVSSSTSQGSLRGPSFDPGAQGDRALGSPTSEEVSVDGKQTVMCNMCSNYESQLVGCQARVAELERELTTLDTYKEQLTKEAQFRKEMEEKWTEKKEKHKIQVTDLQKRMKDSEEALESLRKTYKKTEEEIEKKFRDLTEERKRTQDQLERVQLENENLMGKYNAHAAALQNEEINLPSTVEALQEMWLKQREELIHARIGQERSEENVKSLECFYTASETKARKMDHELSIQRKQQAELERDLKQKLLEIKGLQSKMQSYEHKIHSLEVKLKTLEQEKGKLEQNESELHNRLASLQAGLENGEAVQKDFVRLSQSLQKELENLRAQNNVLRWEYEEDVSECRGCEQAFKSVTKGKQNCRHCGRIFCEACLTHRVVSGPSGKESKVCNVCHTMLNSETAPYFSTDPPHSNK